jgi:hypothetical protein
MGSVRIHDVEELTEKRWNELCSWHLYATDWDPEQFRYDFWLSGARRFSEP